MIVVVRVIQDDQSPEQVTVAQAQLGNIAGVGSSKKHPDDQPNKRVGVQLAAGRALVRLGKRMQRAVMDEVHEREEQRHRQREERRASALKFAAERTSKE